MCGRYASSRRPEDLVEEFEIAEVRVAAPLAPDYNVAPTKQVYAVVRAPAVRVTSAEPPRAPAAGADLGPGAVLGQGPLDRQPDDQRPDGDRGREAGVPPGVRRAPLPAARPTATSSGTPPRSGPQAASRSSSRSSSAPRDGGVLAMAGLYEIWRDPTRGRGRPRPVPLDLHGADHRRRGRPRPHPRPDAADGRARPVAGVARPAAGRRRPTCSTLLVPAAPGRLEAYPVSTAGQQRPQQRAGAGRAAARSRRRSRDRAGMSAERPADHRHPARRRRGWSTSRARQPDRHAAAQPRRRRRHRHRRPRGAGRATCPRNGVTVVRFEQPWQVAGRKVATAPADARRRAARGRRPRMRTRTPLVVGGRSAGARSAARRRTELGAAGCLALSFPLHPPGPSGDVPASTSCCARGPADAGRPGGARPDGPPRGVPRPAVELTVVPAADHGFGCRPAGRSAQDEAMGIVVEATLEWIVREVVGESARRS